MRRLSLKLAVGLGLLAGVLSAPWHGPVAQGQDKGKTTKKPSAKPGSKKPIANTKGLDVKYEQIQVDFLKQADELATQYVEAGHLEKARTLLKSALALNPQAQTLQKKLDQVEESILNANDFEVEVNPSRSWEPAQAMLFENQVVRFQVEGTYKLDLSMSIASDGLPEKDQNKDLIPGMPFGALLGIIVTNGKPGKPFLIGDGRDFTPKETGLLFFRVNTPAGNKNTGKLKVLISGHVKTP
jgi:hypothetical protein